MGAGNAPIAGRPREGGTAHRRLGALAAIFLLLLAWPLGRAMARPETALPPAKQQSVDRKAAAQAYGRAHPAPKEDPDKARPTPGGYREPPRPTGIIAESQAPFSSQDLVVANQWQDQVAGRWVHAYAGALGADPAQGVVLVTVEGTSGSGSLGGRYLTPTKAGSVWIVAAHDLRLTLTTKAGRTFTFDIASRTFGAL